MKKLTLNLLHPDRSDIGYRVLTFNDGEPHIWIDDFDRKNAVMVVTRITNPGELFLLMQVADVLQRHGVEWTLKITYLMSQRMDRVMSFGEALSLDIIINLLNGFGCDKISVLEPHSGRIDRRLHRCVAVGGLSQVNGVVFDSDIIVHPDAGAAERYQHDRRNIIVAQKQRDPNDGHIVSLTLQPDADDIVKQSDPSASLLVIDDLCDGGGTFVRMAQILGARYPGRQRRIFVTHMVNPKGIQTLADNYDEVVFTNSYKDWAHTDGITLPENVRVKDIDKEWI